MKIDLLYFEGCPSWEDGMQNLMAALEAEIHMVNVADNQEATRLKFLGSPSFRLNDVELWPEGREDYNLSCRV